jgi:hypothetical protein
MRSLLSLSHPRLLFDRDNSVQALFPKAFEALLFDELRQRRLPGLLLVVDQLVEILGIPSELVSYLQLGAKEMFA